VAVYKFLEVYKAEADFSSDYIIIAAYAGLVIASGKVNGDINIEFKT
jgi:hypothetical protein